MQPRPPDVATSAQAPPELSGHAGHGDEMIAVLRRFCGAAELYAIWHGMHSDSVLLASDDPANRFSFEWHRMHAAMTLAELGDDPLDPRPLDPRAFRVFWHSRTFVAAIPLDDGTLTLAGTPAASGDAAGAQGIADALGALRPFITACFRQMLADRRLQGLLRSLHGAIEGSGMAAIVLDCHSHVTYANAAAQTLFAQGDGLRQSGEQLVCASLADTVRLHAAIEHLCAGACAKVDLNPVLAVRRARRRPLSVALSGPAAGGETGHEPVITAHVVDPEENLSAMIEPVCRLYGLSHRETQLACALVGGDLLAEAAERLGIQEQTARSYLKQVFAKTETSRQTELITLLLKGAPRLFRPNMAHAVM